MQAHQGLPGVRAASASNAPLISLREVRNAPVGSNKAGPCNDDSKPASADAAANTTSWSDVSHAPPVPATEPTRVPRVDPTTVNGFSASPFTDSAAPLRTAAASQHAPSAAALPLPKEAPGLRGSSAPSTPSLHLSIPIMSTHVPPSAVSAATVPTSTSLDANSLTRPSLHGQQRLASPSQVAISPVARTQGQAQGPQSSVSKPGEATEGTNSNSNSTGPKPVLKMKRTGQGIPLNSSATTSVHRKHPSSSSLKTDPVAAKAQSPGLGKGPGQTTQSKRNAPHKIPPSDVHTTCPPPSRVHASQGGLMSSATRPSGSVDKEPEKAVESQSLPWSLAGTGGVDGGVNDSGSTSFKAKVVNDSFNEPPAPLADDDSDDDIKYEPSTHSTGDMATSPTDGFVVIDSSSEPTDTDTDADINSDSDSGGEKGVGPQQLFMARQESLPSHQGLLKSGGTPEGGSAPPVAALVQAPVSTQPKSGAPSTIKPLLPAPIGVSHSPLDGTEAPMPPPTVASQEDAKPHDSQSQSGTGSETAPVADRRFAGRNSSGTGDGISETEVMEKNAKHTWEYVRPYLSKHTDVPQFNWVQDVIHCPRVREIEWNPARSKDRPFHDSHPRDVTALIVQITGVEAPVPCEQCEQAKGPFEGCIMISPDATPAAKASVLSCANCYYHCRQSQCSHCRNDIQRRERNTTRVSQRPTTYNERTLSDRARNKATSTATSQTQSPLLTGPQTAPMPKASRPLRRYVPSEFTIIEMASKDRSYKTLRGKGGEVQLSYGAIIPDGYELEDTAGPWTCPVLTCRAIFQRIMSLGSHFSVSHRGELYNDNCDGTLSLVGFYDIPAPGHTHCPALVISRNALDKAAPLPNAKAPKAVSSGPDTESTASSSSDTRSLAGNRGTRKSTSNARMIWDYILPHLAHPYKTIVQDPKMASHESKAQLSKLFNLPRKRDIRWRANMRDFRLLDDPGQIGGLLVHLVGEEYTLLEQQKACTNCVRNGGPFDGCYLLSRNAPQEWHAQVQGCANCYFSHQKQACSIKGSWPRRVGDKSEVVSGPLQPVHEWAAAAAASATNKRSRASELDDDDDQADPQSELRSNDEDEQEEPSRKMVKLDLRSISKTPLDDSASPSWATTDTGRASNSSRSKDSRDTRSPPAALVSARQASSNSDTNHNDLSKALEMEDWEVAPGRIRRTRNGRVDNTACSKSYLETGRPVPVSVDANLEVRTVKSGHSFELDSLQDCTRYCCLASGKLHICIDDEPAFTIGPHGMFKVLPQQKARVLNRLYIDSVLHIFSGMNA
ncbi:hypothetical protein BD289DRAFT_47207 [Coniella lustricola]|uniref:C2H2-type domain-containing protein n=1 Tax=Coniella lustricola TaxID=2025994 RepID=A0A2T3AID5_9PEZI|nr:hypothetical protein BD289DRAFT_47207 [Coniella lustricola]